MKILIFLINLLVFGNIFSAALPEKEIVTLQEKRAMALRNKVNDLKSKHALDRFGSLFNLLNFAVKKLQKPPYNDFEKSLYDEVNVLITRLENYLKEPRGQGQDKAAKNILNATEIFKKLIDQLNSTTTINPADYKVRKANSPQEQVDADIDLALNLPDALRKIVSQFAPQKLTLEEMRLIGNANSELYFAKTEEAVDDALRKGAEIDRMLFDLISDSKNNLKKIKWIVDRRANIYPGFNEIESMALTRNLFKNNKIEEIFPVLKILLDSGIYIITPYLTTYLNAPGSEELLKLYNDYLKQKTEGKKS